MTSRTPRGGEGPWSASASPRTSGRARVPGPTATAAPGTSGRAAGPGGRGPGGRFPGGPGAPVHGRRPGRRRWQHGVLIGCVVALVLAILAFGGLFLYARGLDDDLARTDPFSAITAGRPAKTVEGSLNILLVGSDSRDPETPVDRGGEARADTLILMHVPASQDRAYLISIPRDLWVPIPEEPSAPCNGDRGKVNAAFAFGGLPLAVRTVECFTDVRIDHVMAIDFGGFQEVTDALGGVDLTIERDFTSIHTPFRKYKKGVQHLNGEQALDYIRQRKQFPEGDFARMRHQQDFLKALMDKAVSTGTVTNPAKLDAFLKSVTKAVTVDQEFSLVDMAVQFRDLRSDKLVFLTSPHRGSDTIDGESVVVSDREKALALYRAVATDKVAEWQQANPR